MGAVLALSAQAQESCQFQISRHSSISCQFGPYHRHPDVVIVRPHQHPPAWTQSPVFTNPPPIVIYEQAPQVIYVHPGPVYIAPGMRVPDLPYQPNPYMPYYNPNPYPRSR